MFYCDDCAKKKKYPISWFKSYGNCEICGKTRECNEVPSKDLIVSKYTDSNQRKKRGNE